MGLIPMLCGVLFPTAMLGVIVGMGRLEELMLGEPEPRNGPAHPRRRR